jgi:hypothetical protein
VGDDQDATLLVEDPLLDEGNDHFPGITVEGRRGLIQNQDLRPAHDRPGNGHALLLTTGKLDRQNVPRS